MRFLAVHGGGKTKTLTGRGAEGRIGGVKAANVGRLGNLTIRGGGTPARTGFQKGSNLFGSSGGRNALTRPGTIPLGTGSSGTGTRGFIGAGIGRLGG